MSTNNNMSSQEFYKLLFELISYIIISSRNLIEEPKLYGPLRMLEIARRLVMILNNYNIKTPIKNKDFIKNLEVAKSSIIKGEASFVKNLDNLVKEIITYLTD